MIPAPEPVTGAGARNSNPRAPARRPLNTPRTTVSLDVPAHQPRARPRFLSDAAGIRTTVTCSSPRRGHPHDGAVPSFPEPRAFAQRFRPLPPAPPSPCRECPAPGTHTPAPCPTPVSGAQPHARSHAPRPLGPRATRLPGARATRQPGPLPHACPAPVQHTCLRRPCPTLSPAHDHTPARTPHARLMPVPHACPRLVQHACLRRPCHTSASGSCVTHACLVPALLPACLPTCLAPAPAPARGHLHDVLAPCPPCPPAL
ncbi:hypothetical protein GKJPGBOP_06872 [Streptomyces paromomycinus]|uniref:Uncharacterized protein n=1 Tax=Streptomyces paromomycinus TaxID=92743 RepID=A0A401WCP6_STREY|nr:hypothetical protein GKJPGBOP_06872 [Streptomyces paromomycinus]